MPKLVNMLPISMELYNQLLAVLTWCEARKNCHDCKIHDICKDMLDKHGIDFSCVRIGKVDEQPVIFFDKEER